MSVVDIAVYTVSHNTCHRLLCVCKFVLAVVHVAQLLWVGVCVNHPCMAWHGSITMSGMTPGWVNIDSTVIEMKYTCIHVGCLPDIYIDTLLSVHRCMS